MSNYSPKNLLATYLSQSLATLFININSHQIQSNLIQDAHVILNNVAIKPRYFCNDDASADCCSGEADGFTSNGISEPCRERKANTTTQHIKVYGNIDQIEFTWVWDASSSSFIKDVQLLIRGVHVHIAHAHDESDMSSNVDNNETYENSEQENDTAILHTSVGDDWKSKHLQQIIDHLTLIVTDVTISIHTSSSLSSCNHNTEEEGEQVKKKNDDVVIMLRMKDVELKTVHSGGGNFGGNDEESDNIDENAALLQTIRFGLVEAWLERETDQEDENDNKLRYATVLAPFEYQANVTRIAGRRFLDGIQSGLLVEGKKGSSSNSIIRVYAGIEQMDALRRLQVVLPLLLNLGEKIQNVKESDGNDDNNSGTDVTKEDGGIKVPKSVFHLPIESIEVVLKNEMCLRLSDCTVRFGDGTVLSIDFVDGMWEYDEQELRFDTIHVRVQHDGVDKTTRVISQIGKVSGNGMVSFNALRTTLTAHLCPTQAPLIELDVATIDSLKICASSLKSPGITNLTMSYNQLDNELSCHIPYLYIQRYAKKDAPAVNQLPSLPYKTKLTVDSFHLVDGIDELNQTINSLQETRCRSLTIALDPMILAVGEQEQSIERQGIAFQVDCNEFESVASIKTAVKIPSISISGLLESDLRRISNLVLAVEKAQLSAEFSSSHWAESLEEEKVAILLPFAVIPRFKLTLRFTGPLIKLDDATIACDEFRGYQRTSLEGIKKHYLEIAKKRIPYLIAKTESPLVGGNIADSAAMIVGTTLTRTTVIGATVGVVSRDLIGSTVTQGKVSRGADSSDNYEFGKLDSWIYIVLMIVLVAKK
jgi:hypothetical protein